MDLAGKVVVVPADWPELATKMASLGATVVVAGPDAGALGRLAGEMEAAGAGRPAVFVTDDSGESLDALAAFLSELFRAP
ncbi:MAG TPA: hypothetical protein VNT52_13200 [Acidimicrobiales bacterium]|nr:hypothetical protein [Acidimicrobiales bacterium]